MNQKTTPNAAAAMPSPVNDLAKDMAEAMHETRYAPLTSDQQERIRVALLGAALRVLGEVLVEASEAAGDLQAVRRKASLAYLKHGLECAALASPGAAPEALAIDLVREAADRLAALGCVQFGGDMLPSVLHTGADPGAVYVAPNSSKGGAAAPLLADLAGISLHVLVADCWIASQEKSEELRTFWLKNAGRRD